MASKMASSALEGHEKCCKKVCILCYKRGNRSISQKEMEHIQDNIIHELKRDNLDFPSAICKGCHLLLNKRLNGFAITLPHVESYDPERPLLLRDTQCNCKICKVATSSVLNVPKPKPGRPKSTPDAEQMSPHLVICSKCFSRIGKGFKHDCTRRGKVSNLENHLLTSPTTAQRVASRVVTTTTTSYLATLGPNSLPINSSLPSKKKLFTVEDMSLFQQDIGLSNRKVKRLAEDIRSTSGCRLIIEKGMSENLREKNHRLEDFFQATKCNFTMVNEATKLKKNYEQHITVCTDLNGLVDKIIEERHINQENMLVRIGMDGGSGFL